MSPLWKWRCQGRKLLLNCTPRPPLLRYPPLRFPEFVYLKMPQHAGFWDNQEIY